MPELPEVETIVRRLRPVLVGQRILGCELIWKRSLVTPSPRKFEREIIGQEIREVSRRAKFLDLRLDVEHLILHLRMSGALYVVAGLTRPDVHDRLLLHLSGDASLVFHDPRKFGRVWLVEDPAAVLARIGPEPLSETFTPDGLYAALRDRRRLLKPLLLDQSFVAGLGNIYTDEALHLARLNPLRRSDSLSPAEAAGLYRAIRTTLEEGIRRNGASIDWVYRGGQFQNQFRVYRRAGQPCPVCGTPIERLLVGQRGTHFCPNCQPVPE
jgi:formamidopyrimidine-DNA glycosylase